MFLALGILVRTARIKIKVELFIKLSKELLWCRPLNGLT